MTTILLSDIIIEDRLRKDYGSDNDLDTIATVGLIQPLVLQETPNGYKLIAGGRRFAWLTANGYLEAFHGATSDPLRPGFVFRDELPPDQQLEIEILENFGRKDLSWREIAKGVHDFHHMLKRRAALAGEKWTLQQTGDRLGGYGDNYVSENLDLFHDLQNTLFDTCDTLVEAVKLKAQLRVDAAVKEQARRSLAAAKANAAAQRTLPLPATSQQCIACAGLGLNSKGNECPICRGTGITESYTPVAYEESPPTVVNLTNTIILSDCIDWLRQRPDASVDHIITDPPYGIDVGFMDQATKGISGISRIEETHTVSGNESLFVQMLPEFYRVLRPHSFCLLWCDIMQWQNLVNLSEASGFSVQRWPHVWCKSSSCLNQQAYTNETKATEFVLVLRREEAKLAQSVAKNYTLADGMDGKLSNPFAKPFAVWQPLIDSFTHPNQTILDPFAGEGTCPLAALRLGRQTIAVEKDETHYVYLVEEFKRFHETKGKVTFT